MKNWGDTTEIEKHFGIETKGSLDDLRAELREMLLEVHPNATGGEFKNADQKVRYDDLETAIEFVDERRLPVEGRSLGQAIQAQNELVGRALKETQQALAQIQSERRLEGLADRARTSIKKSVSNKFAPQKFGGGFLVALSVFLLAIRGPLNEFFDDTSVEFIHPVILAIIPFVLGLGGAFSALFAYNREQRENRSKEFILAEGGFREFLLSKPFAKHLDYGESSTMPDKVSLGGIVQAISDFTDIRDPSTCQEIAELVAERLLNRDLAVRLEGAFLSPTFQLTRGLAEEIEAS